MKAGKKPALPANAAATAMATRSTSARKAWQTRQSPRYLASRSERRSKQALSSWAEANRWKVVFFEGKRGAPRTGVVDAVLVRIAHAQPDVIEVRLVQLKGGAGGLTAAEIARLKRALVSMRSTWVLAAFDGAVLHFLPEDHDPKHGA